MEISTRSFLEWLFIRKYCIIYMSYKDVEASSLKIQYLFHMIVAELISETSDTKRASFTHSTITVDMQEEEMFEA
ncbi:unnamed protein product [Auanema sp. JU1783]|nr:unnamed protein product [Auanema sp. JU1783]